MPGSRATVIFPSDRRLIFDGGLNTKFDPALIALNESPDCANVVFTNGSVATRGGTSQLNTTAVGSWACDGLYTKRTSAGGETMCAWFGTHMFTLAGTTFTTVPSAQSVFTAGQRVFCAEYQDNLFIGNGGLEPYKYSGSEFTRHGIPSPVMSGMTGTSSASGVLTGDYKYLVTYVNTALVEGNISTATATFTFASATVGLTGVPVAPKSYGVNTRYIYRTEASGATFYRCGSISDNSTTTFSDNVTDASLTAQAPTDNGCPPKYSVIIYHQNRLFCNDSANPNFLWYSDLNEPYTWSALGFIRIGDDTSDLIRTLSVHENSLLVCCDNSQWLIYMPDTTPSNWQTIKIKSSFGSKSPFAHARYNDKTWFAAVQNYKFMGFGAVKGTATEQDVTFLTTGNAGAELKSERIEPDMLTVNSTYQDKISAIVFKNRIYCAVPYSTSTVNNKIYVYDFSNSNLSKSQEGAWVPYTGLYPAQFCIYGGNLYYGSANAVGAVYRLETSTASDGTSAIDSYYWTKEFSGYKGDEGTTKDFRRASLFFEKYGSYYMNLKYRANSDKGVGVYSQIDLDPQTQLWGTMVFGVDPWGGGATYGELNIPLGASMRGERIQFGFSNQNVVDQKFHVLGLTFQYNRKGIR